MKKEATRTVMDVEGLSSEEKVHRRKAEVLLAECKRREEKEDLVCVRVDRLTVKLIPRERAIKQGLIKP